MMRLGGITLSEFDELLNEELKDEEFRSEYEALLTEFAAVPSVVRKHTIDVFAPLTPEQKEMLMNLKDREPVPDEDCPELKAEELKEMRRISEKNADCRS